MTDKIGVCFIKAGETQSTVCPVAQGDTLLSIGVSVPSTVAGHGLLCAGFPDQPAQPLCPAVHLLPGTTVCAPVGPYSGVAVILQSVQAGDVEIPVYASYRKERG